MARSLGSTHGMADTPVDPVSRTPLEPGGDWIAALAEAHGVVVADRARLAVQPAITELETRFQRLYERVARRAASGHRGSRVEEWLLDNWHVVQRALEQVRESLPRSYTRQLPCIRDAQGRAQWRVHALARGLAAHGDQPLDIAQIVADVTVYQRTCVLTIGEVWALPAALRWVLLDDLLNAAEQAVPSARGEDTAESHAAPGMSVAGCILSLRALESDDWRDSAESLMAVEAVLRSDPRNAYARMDFMSRDRYRKAIERFARRTGIAEIEVARAALECARQPASEGYRQHIGYYLIDDGRATLSERLGRRVRRPWYEPRHGLASLLYFVGLAVFAMPPWLGLGWFLAAGGTPIAVTALVMLLTAVLLASLASGLINGLITHWLPPRSLPKLNFEAGIPDEARAAVAVPVLLARGADVGPLIERLETNYLNNDDRNLVYVVLCDLADAPRREMAGDERLLDTLRRQIDTLNTRYRRNQDSGPFLALNRRREWNPAQHCWMGWERKRGKLLQFNRLVTGRRDDFETIAGDRGQLAAIRYVITLDADTAMPQGAAAVLIGTLAHPLNEAIPNGRRTHVVRGYAFLQPRLDTDPSTTEPTRFTQVFDSDATVDLYTNAVSNVYQDLFGEGIFAGKGIYDPHVIAETLADRLPPNALLSHDLLEGSLGRTALVSDTRFYEQFPSNVFVYLRRSHRWIRGDWQLLPWLWRWVPTSAGRRETNPLKLVQQWQILDNLRRSVTAPTLLTLLCVVWIARLPASVWVWTLLVIALSAVSIWVTLLTTVWACIADWQRLPQHLAAMRRPLRQRSLRLLLSLCLMPYESLFVLDGVGRTLYRMRISRCHLLDWRTAHDVHHDFGAGRTMSVAWRDMWISPATAIVLTAVLAIVAPYSLMPAAPFLLAWLIAPALAHYVSGAPPEHKPRLAPAERQVLRDVARRTWFFFERFMGPDDHWLPPDNFQEEPRGVLARRTSPTNIGMGLLSALAAYDLGYLDLFSLAARLNSSFERIGTLERHRGHWLNWYETRELTPLAPRYVSTVDSGNLAAALLTLARGIDRLVTSPIEPQRLLSGIRDTLSLLESAVITADSGRPTAAERQWIAGVRARRALIDANATDDACWTLLKRLCEREIPALRNEFITLVDRAGAHLTPERLTQLHHWLDELRRQATLARHFGDQLLPWRRLFDQPPALYRADAAAAPPPVARYWRMIVRQLARPVTLADAGPIGVVAERLLDRLDSVLVPGAGGDARYAEAIAWNRHLRHALVAAGAAATHLRDTLERLAQQADTWVAEMDFTFLYDPARHLFRIGYNLDEARLDSGYYDLIASEARLTSFLAIAKGDVPQRHWLHLGRPFRALDGRIVLMSWGATLFEYLMPALFLPSPNASLIGRACRRAVDAHVAFAQRMRVPWGISESGFYQFDAHANYQYRAFGIPGIGFRRDVGDRLVVSAYSSLMALPFRPHAVVDNIRALEKEGGLGEYGLYEAIDYGPSSAPRVTRRASVVRSYMSHHQGMLLLAIDNQLNDEIMPKRFQADPRIARLSNLLHERAPTLPAALPPWPETRLPKPFVTAVPLPVWSPERVAVGQRYNLLSNGHLSLLQSADGSGGCRWEGVELTRWTPDPTRERQGHWCYIRDLDHDTLASVGLEPEGGDPDSARTLFTPHHVEHQRRVSELFCRLRIAVACEDDVEIRHLLIKNETGRHRRLLVAGYAEVVLAPAAEDTRHPAFTKLFVQSRYLASHQTLVFRRRPRGAREKPLYLAHAVHVAPGARSRLRWETSRERFVGRLGSAQSPQALKAPALSGFTQTVGTVLDPVMATGLTLELAPHAETEIVYVTAVGYSRPAVLDTVRRYRSLSRARWVFDQARMAAEQELSELRIAPLDVIWMMRLLSLLRAPSRASRAPADILRASDQIQSSLWGRGISGDAPILLARVHASDDADFARRLLQAHLFWGIRGEAIDLVLLDESPGGYVRSIRDRLQTLVTEIRGRTQRPTGGQVHLVAASELAEADRTRLWASAGVVLDAGDGPIPEQLKQTHEAVPVLPPFVAIGRSATEHRYATPPLERPTDLEFDNGLGGFADDGREYVIHLASGQSVPAPWSNVIANPEFGCLTTDAGLGCTWAGNSGENRLTPWRNDPVCDPASEVVYLRDEETAEVWTPTPAPRPADGAYQIRHGFGYTEYRHHSHGIEQRLRVTVDREAPVKIVRLDLTNRWPWTRRLTATYYLEWVLGTTRAATASHIVVDHDADHSVLLARNAFVRDAEPGVGFVTASQRPHGLTADRTEFIGRTGGLEAPAALFRIGLSGCVEPGVDPCAAYQVHVDLPSDTTRSVYFIVGQGRSRDDALALAARFRDRETAAEAEQTLAAFWARHLGCLQVHTPDRAADIMINHWLQYQVLSCRLWGRTGYYQSSGAYGFRDQLQDVLALSWSQPDWTRAHILRAAGRQFAEGDVLHWWHERPLRGVRTRYADDLLWLPYVTAQYVQTTGDAAILAERVAYLDGTPLEPGETERYSEYAAASHDGSLYEHCVRAIEHASRYGAHGLPLIGGGDWNDGYNRIGAGGQGESVWLGWFIVRILRDFAPLCALMDDEPRGDRYKGFADRLQHRIDDSAWDGDWYRRAYFDDGTPLGSAENDECQIDLMTQTWAVLAETGDNARARQAMATVYERLVRDDSRQILLLAPPFDRTHKDPGYIRGYPPGIRENGGQYTHGAVWAVWAAAGLGDAERAWQLFSLLNPVLQATGPEQIARYRTEPYVLAGDIYSVAPHAGRGGWTWYTGAAGWFWRGGVEALLGLRIHHGTTLEIAPVIPADWPGFQATLYHGDTRYEIDVAATTEPRVPALSVTLDGEPMSDARVPLQHDDRLHHVAVRIARASA